MNVIQKFVVFLICFTVVVLVFDFGYTTHWSVKMPNKLSSIYTYLQNRSAKNNDHAKKIYQGTESRINRWQLAVPPDFLYVYSAYFDKQIYGIRIIALARKALYSDSKNPMTIACTFWTTYENQTAKEIVPGIRVNVLDEHHGML